ncbi:four helix bundle protein [Candidatus Falkowbacteria bacterium]|jgi:four helix bundle protein|nr:four helix bundle protein [Candidatus Falkowbacteria bacterium]MBT5503038.1 four helix bundle protein [Candidatus Falkowbacteria bacterium]MBT6574143.1 four helix bundle protein [Candidatus Falkowbacteria bacterium]MBT7348710.1 four helix bundle protein [Candidatus Falkowbacteria bacterium]MBT7500500.1 four helix bundle protein [Candidatus Falkowbacteria bacterium]
MRVEDLDVYKKLFTLTLEINHLTKSFPKFELFELGSQLRRSSNSPPANLAEGFGNKHTNIYLECISRAQGEIRETKHHLKIATAKGYLTKKQLFSYILRYNECSKMLYGLEKSLILKHKK